MKYFLSAFIVIITFFSFSNHECQHVYTLVEKDTLNISEGSTFVPAIYRSTQLGYQQGPELICVKCFHTKKQIIHYGEEKLTVPNSSKPIIIHP